MFGTADHMEPSQIHSSPSTPPLLSSPPTRSVWIEPVEVGKLAMAAFARAGGQELGDVGTQFGEEPAEALLEPAWAKDVQALAGPLVVRLSQLPADRRRAVAATPTRIVPARGARRPLSRRTLCSGLRNMAPMFAAGVLFTTSASNAVVVRTGQFGAERCNWFELCLNTGYCLSSCSPAGAFSRAAQRQKSTRSAALRAAAWPRVAISSTSPCRQKELSAPLRKRRKRRFADRETLMFMPLVVLERSARTPCD